jgi:quinolinate synthase
VHEQITTNSLKSLKQEYPKAEIIVHPECPASVRHLSDFVGSTSQMSRYVKQSVNDEFIVGTEDNFLYRLKTDNPHKKFHSVNTLCEGMGKITLEKVKISLERMENKVHVSEDIRQKAKNALDGMLRVT